MSKNLKLIFLGAPGAGKGTQADVISEKYGIPTISTGAMIREAIKNQTEMGLAAKAYSDRGDLVPDEVVINIIKERLAQDDCKNGFILDGFPRTVPQAEALDKMGVEISLVLSLEVEDSKIVERMSGRRVCPKCSASYHTAYLPAADGVHCDKCGEELIIRRDDAPEVVVSRLFVYHEQTEPLKEFYGKKGILKLVMGQEEVADTTALTINAIEESLAE
jgi:adenylate kinase